MCERCGVPVEFTDDGYLIHHTSGCPPAPDARDPGDVASAPPEPPEVSPKPALPPQLCRRLGDAAPHVAGFCEMAPGIPWSAEILDDMLGGTDLEHKYWQLDSGREDGMKIQLRCDVDTRKVKKQTLKEIVTRVETRMPRERRPSLFAVKAFPFDRAGLRRAIEFTQGVVNKLKQKGFCPCWETYTPPPDLDIPATKRICVGKTGRCVCCIMKLAHE